MDSSNNLTMNRSWKKKQFVPWCCKVENKQGDLFPVSNISSVPKRPFGVPEGTEVLIVIKTCRPRCVYIGGLLIDTPLEQG